MCGIFNLVSDKNNGLMKQKLPQIPNESHRDYQKRLKMHRMKDLLWKKGIDIAGQCLSHIPGLGTKGPGALIPLLIYSPETGGCDDSGNCSDQMPPWPIDPDP